MDEFLKPINIEALNKFIVIIIYILTHTYSFLNLDNF